MAELWRELLTPLDKELADSLSLRRVTAARSGDRLTIALNAKRLLRKGEFEKIRRCLAAGFPGAQVFLRVSYHGLKEQVLKDIGLVSGFVTDLVAEKYPGARPILTAAAPGWRLGDGVLSISLEDPAGAGFLKARGVDAQIARHMKEMFGIDCRVALEASGNTEARLEEIARRRREEEERFAAIKQAQQKEQEQKPELPRQIFGKDITEAPTPIAELTDNSGRVVLKGEVFGISTREIKSGTKLVLFSVSDATGAAACKMFLGGKRGEDKPEIAEKQWETFSAGVREGSWILVRGSWAFDDFEKDMVLRVSDINPARAPERVDTADRKRVELHLHTQMSTMDALASAGDLIAQAAKWGHKAIAVTDHGVVQAFPEAFNAAKKNNIKLLPGCEGYLIDNSALVVRDADDRPVKDAVFVVFDVETTGLKTSLDTILEIGAVRFENGREVAEFSQLINPGRPVPEKVTKLTGITDAMVRDMPEISRVVGSFAEFCKGAVLCAHNADFDSAFMRRAFEGNGIPFEFPVLDTLTLSRNLLKGQKSHKLSAICKTLGVSLKNAHRAVHDARATAQALMIMLERVEGLERLNDLNNAFSGDAGSSHHIILLAKNRTGMTNLNRLVSESHLKHFYRTPRMPRSLIEKYREGLIIGSACEAGELYRAFVGKRPDAEIRAIASFYDYLEIQPLANNAFLVREGQVEDEEALREINRRIVALGEELGKPVVATGDVHFKEPEDAIYRAILMNAKGFEDADYQPPLYFRTTDDMLAEFAYLGEDVARRVVVDETNRIADMVEDGITIFVKHPEGKETFQPFWEEAEDDIRRLTAEKAQRIYGNPLPEIVEKRIEKELGSIIGYGFSTLYDIAVKLVKKSLSDGYIVGSRGSVGSSFVAFATGITEVNALPPHYVCPKCRHSEFDVPEEYTCGLDLPPKNCPVCGESMDRDGFDIPFEVFLGFKGDKVPDIDLNFSGEYQPRAHKYVKELFGVDNVFRAGTISTVAEKTAYGYVLKYLEERGKAASNAEKNRLARGCTGVKRITGQHPAGMVVLPKDYEIYQFTAIQHPADDTESETITTHYDFSSMHDVLVKLDILGHDDPTMLKKLQDLTGIAPQQVPLHDPEVFRKILSLFTGTEALGVTSEEIGTKTGTHGVPEFGTRFVRGMLEETRPSTMEELIRISGLSHGTDVWIGNARDLVTGGIAPLRKCICTRDDIMNQLIKWGVESKMAFTTMESVRKGRGLKPEMEQAMRDVNTPEWFIDSCKKIKYMFPKAHAVAYVTMALRIAYFKIYYPVEYYACYLKRNIDDFDALTMVAPIDVIKERLKELRGLDKSEGAKKESQITVMEILVEMLARGIRLEPISMYDSHPQDFRVLSKNAILPPLLSLPGLGLAAAENFDRVRREGPFISRDDMERRKVSRSVIELLSLAGALGDLPETSQVSLFEGF